MQTPLRIPFTATSIVGILAIVIGAVVAGGSGIVAAGLGIAVVMLFFAVGQIVVGRVLANNPALGLNVALGVYLLQVVVLFILLAVLQDATFFDPQVFAGTIVAGALTWLVTTVVGYSRQRQLYVEPESSLGLSDDPDVIALSRKEEQ